MDHGKFDAAVKDYAEYVNRRPEEHQFRYEYGKALLAAGQANEAEKQLKIASDVQPMNDEYLDARAEAMFAAGEREELTSMLARNAAERGRVADYTRMGKYAAKMGHPDEAKEALLTAAKLDHGRSFGVQKDLADFYGSVGDKTNEVKRLRMAFFLNPADEQVAGRLRKLGEVPGPSAGLRPTELTTSAADK
jgi:tetratricopeptide (TPR) repeat protein